MQYLSVPNWDKYQHYRDRSPKWIKLHQAVLDSYEFGRLQDSQKAHVMLIWLLASKLDNRIPADPKWIARKIGSSAPVDVDALIQAGFLEVEHVASDSVQNATEVEPTVLAQRESRERVEGEVEVDRIAPRRKTVAKPTEVLEPGILDFPTVGTNDTSGRSRRPTWTSGPPCSHRSTCWQRRARRSHGCRQMGSAERHPPG